MSSDSAKTRWFTEVLDSASLRADAVSAKARELKQLDQWFMDTLASLNDAELEFYPCVPEDDTPAQLKLRALGEFCSGFTYGIGIASGLRANKPFPKDTMEIIDDFQAIESADELDSVSVIGDNPDETDEKHDEQERIYQELLEYVRVGVLLVLEELRPVTRISQEMPS